MAAHEPEWLLQFIARAPAADVVAAWFQLMGPEGFKRAAADPHAARTALRVAIVDYRTTCESIYNDSQDGWKYTGSLLRAVDAAFALPPPGHEEKLTKAKCPPGSIGTWSDRAVEMAAPAISLEPLDPALVSSWRSELRQASSEASRSHSWAGPHWIPIESVGDATLLDRTIKHVLRLSASISSTIEAETVGAEFWTQRVDPHAPCKLHWDCDEMLGQSDSITDCPLMSAIVYISDEGGPTLMIGRSPIDDLGEHAAWLERGWLVWPHCGQVAAFPGNMLHGVLPLRTQSATRRTPTLRQTVLINLWAKRPSQLPELEPEIAPRLAESEAELADAEALAEAISMASGEGAPSAPGMLRAPPEAGSVRRKSWPDSASQGWEANELRQGMFFGHSNWWVQLPPCGPEYRNYQVEEFTANMWPDRFKSHVQLQVE